jgi:hypothetical protein
MPSDCQCVECNCCDGTGAIFDAATGDSELCVACGGTGMLHVCPLCEDDFEHGRKRE